MRQLVTVEYRCARHESPRPKGECSGCDAVRDFEAWADKLRESRLRLVAKIKEKMAAKEITIVEMR